jgi:exonuclease SbcC
VIPLRLKLSGFLSYRDAVELDFTSFDLACISGPNGAGKSSLLDAITWALFGQARKRDESLINSHPGVKAAEVSFTFAYEENVYRVQRTLPRGKTTTLEFQILQSSEQSSVSSDQSSSTRNPQLATRTPPPGIWRPLTERTLRDTQARIEQILRLDYDTFVNAAFFLQGKADQFAQQSPGKRKEILSNILGLEIWETYRDRAAERRKSIERELDSVDGRIQEIDAELSEEPARKERLAELEAQLKGLAKSRKAQEAVLENVKKVAASLEQQRKLVETLAVGLERSSANLAGLQARLAEREAERGRYADLLARAAEVESVYQAWQAARAELERWEQVAGQFREHEKRRQPLLDEINAEKAKLEQERDTLLNQQKGTSDQFSMTMALQTELEGAKKALAEAEAQVTQRAELEMQAQASREKQAELRAENVSLKAEMDELKARIEQLEATDGAVCPLCGQPLSHDERQDLIALLTAQGREMGDRWRANKTALEELASNFTNLESQLSNLASAVDEHLTHATTVSQLTERLETMQRTAADWESVGKPRLAEITFNLQHDNFVPQARVRLAEVDKELAALGYDAAAHDAARRSEVEGRAAEADFRALESARAALKPLEDEITNLESNISNLEQEISRQRAEHEAAAAALAAVEFQAPDLESAERALFDLQEQENQLNQEVGAARQKVTVLDDLRARKVKLEAERGELGLAIGRFRSLERAFGRDGVPALLIEQALPQIESKANDLLDRLSDGAMSVRFITQAAYKDRNRADLRETLDIQISDGAGAREYEMFSGGEAFRINFAIRLALSEVLARRKGARLQTLIIDEGFGSQDNQGRQRLIEAVNAVHSDFAKILVITHLDELKDVFPTRIEVEKTERGSVVKVI